MALPFEGKTAVITGSSRGIGKAIALELARQGADIAVCARSEEGTYDLPGSIGETKAEIEALGRRALALKVDVGSDEDVAAMFEAIDREFGRLDVVVNNAGFMGSSMTTFTETATPDLLETGYRVNLRAPYVISQIAIPRMTANGGGAIFNITSGAARSPAPPKPGEAPRGGFNSGIIYGITKAGLDRFAAGAAVELAPLNIAVININPGLTITERLERNPRPGMDVSRGQSPDVTAKAVAFLCKDPMKYTGTIITSSEIVAEQKL